MTDQKIASIIRSRYDKLYDKQKPIFDKVEQYHQMYRAEVDEDDSWQWDYNLVDPVIFYLVRTMMAKFNPDSFKVRLEARTQKDLANREINQQVVNWELEEMSKTLVFYNFIFRGILAGRSYLKTGWLFNKALEITEGDTRKVIMRDIVNRGYAKNIRFNDLFIPNANNPFLDEQPYLIERVLITYGEMLDDNKTQDREIWDASLLKKIREKNMFETTVDYGVDLLQDDEALSKDKENTFLRNQFVSLLRMQTKDNEVFYIPTQQEEWILNKNRGNEYWHGHYPYITWTPFPEDDEFFSMGVVQPVADLQIALTDSLNQFLTNARKAGNPMWIAGSGASQTPDWMFVNRPDGIIRVVGEPNQVVQARTIDTSETMLNMRREMLT